MKDREKIKKFIKNPKWAIVFLNNKGIHILNDKTYIKLLYGLTIGKKLNLENPQTFNEKIQWLKLNDRKNEYTIMADKLAAKEYVAKIIGKEYIIPTLKKYDSFKDINFEDLPNQFVMKCTHDSGGIVVCKDKSELNLKETKKAIKHCLNKNFYWSNREWPYKNIEPKIIVEKYMVDDEIKELRDYKFFCFNGSPKFFKIDFDRFTHHGANYYDTSGKLMKFGEEICPPDYKKQLKMPNNLNKMIKLAKKLSSGIPFVRIDFYEVNNKVYFGEITLYPAAGFGKFIPDEWDAKLGNMIDLKKVKINND